MWSKSQAASQKTRKKAIKYQKIKVVLLKAKQKSRTVKKTNEKNLDRAPDGSELNSSGRMET